MNDLQCNEFYDVVIDAVLTSVIIYIYINIIMKGKVLENFLIKSDMEKLKILLTNIRIPPPPHLSLKTWGKHSMLGNLILLTIKTTFDWIS